MPPLTKNKAVIARWRPAISNFLELHFGEDWPYSRTFRELRETAKIAVKRDWVEASEFRETPGRVKNKMMELLLQGMESIAEK